MRFLAPLLVLAACSHPQAPPPPEQLAAQPPPAAILLDTLIARNVVGILEAKPDSFAAAVFTTKLLGHAPCVMQLQQNIARAYQLQVPKVDGNGATSYFVLEGDVPREAAAGCIASAGTAIPLAVRTDGDLLAIAGPDGATAYAGWRGPFVVVGPRGLVEQVLGARAAASPRWHDMLATARTAPMWWGSSDALIANMFEVPTLRYQVVFERVEVEPNPYFAGRAYISYTTAGDAAIAARRIKAGELHLPFEAPELADAFRRMTVKQDGTRVEVGFDLAMFAGITQDTLAGWAAQLPH